MNRKVFLQRATLATLAAAGINKLRAASPADDTLTYKSKERLNWDGAYTEFEINISLGEFLNPSKDSTQALYIHVSGYKDAYDRDASSIKGFNYLRTGTPKSENGNISFSYKESGKNDESNKLPKKLNLIYMKGGDIISLEYEKNAYTNLEKQVKSSDDDCFLTTACTIARHLPDDCEELQTLRRFRNEQLQPTADGEVLIKDYYSIAPGIVASVNKLGNANEIWNEVYEELVVPTKAFIDNGENAKAIAHYKNYVLLMKDIFTN